ncbi:MAG: Na/Pi cotransporter family protein [Pseudomonadota bacterium]
MSGSLVLLNLLGAVALLLWGLRMVRTAAERALGADLDRHLRRIAGRRMRAFAFGGLGAATLQSSTAVVLLGAGFVAKARLTLAAGLALALGADVGTAIAAQILSLNISALIPCFLLAGYVLFQWSSSKRLRNLGRACIGLGLILTALTMIVSVSASLQASEMIPLVIGALADEPTLAILLAAILTWIAHSSLAIVLMIASLTLAGVVSGPAALYLLLGANLGAALPALAASMAEPMAGRRVPIGNFLFRGVGVLCLVWSVPGFYALLSGSGLADQKIVVLGHLAFNVTVALAALPFVGLIGRALERFLPSQIELDRPRGAPRHLHQNALHEPDRALGNARREALRLADFVQEMLDDSQDALSPETPVERLAAIGLTEDEVDSLNNAIKFYVTEITRAELSLDQSRQAHSVISFSTNMEHIGDIVDRNIRRLADRKRKANLTFSEQGAAEIDEIYEHVRESMQLAVAAFMADDEEIAEQLIAKKRNFRDDEQAANHQHLERLREGNAASIDTSSIHLDLLRDLKRIHSHLTAIAYTITDREPVLLRGSA